jgi:Na+/H+ antiporter NhaD/arsenite permease-like protein
MTASPTALQIAAATIFAIAIAHTFATGVFERLAHAHPAHGRLFHLLGEVEAVFGFWAMVLLVVMFALAGPTEATRYIDSRDFTEPLFVFAIMIVAASRPILHAAAALVRVVAARLPVEQNAAFLGTVLCLVPLLGSFITEPAAMTLAALMLRDRLFSCPLSNRLKYAIIGVLFVNVSIGGTLTPFAAPPVLMVAETWGWGFSFMLTTFGWRSVLAVAVNTLALVWMFRRELAALPARQADARSEQIPAAVVLIHVAFLAGIVVFAHHPALFMGLVLFFIGFAHAYERYQDRLIIREALMVAFFLAGLVVLGGQQQWWLKPVLLSMSADQVYYGATALTAITDNAALTYLGSLVEGLSDAFKVALVAGAVTGGGLTIIANAPNPAGFAILKEHLEDQALDPLKLLLAALPPTLVAVAAFRLL